MLDPNGPRGCERRLLMVSPITFCMNQFEAMAGETEQGYAYYLPVCRARGRIRSLAGSRHLHDYLTTLGYPNPIYGFYEPEP